MGKAHWYIRTYIGRSLIRKEGFSTRIQCITALKEYWPFLDNFAPYHYLNDNTDVAIYVMSKGASGDIRTLHLVITNNHPSHTVFVPKRPVIFSMSPTIDQLNAGLVHAGYRSYPNAKDWEFSQALIDMLNTEDRNHELMQKIKNGTYRPGEVS